MSGPVYGDTNPESRRPKADKIANILSDALQKDLSEARVLDVGCGIGVIAERLRTAAGCVVGMEMERSLIKLAPPALNRLQGDGLRLPFGDAAFDVVICAQVYEHVTDSVRLVAEIRRVLRPGGVCFFSGPNRLWPYEYHYGTWFIHWLPDLWRDRSLVRLKRGHLPRVQLRTWPQLRRLWQGCELQDYTVEILRHPERFPGTGAPRWLRWAPVAVLNLLVWFIPNVNWVLRQPTESTGAGSGGTW